MFKVCGDIVLVRILRPGNPIPADVRPFVNKHPEMAGKVCALVEFERTEFAMKAIAEKNCEEEEKMKVGNSPQLKHDLLSLQQLVGACACA